jgi:CHAD domain-containing protein
MVTEHRETERKYEAGSAAFTLPPLDGLPGVASVSDVEQETLEAEYYDTPDLRLIGAGITLRRRRGGADEGWHLKLPAGQDTRRELRLPLEDGDATIPGDIPEELAGLVRAYSRGEPLTPVAHISTVRRRRTLMDADGDSLAEVVADDVTSQSLGRTTTITSWQEAEVELTGGGPSLLKAADKRLLGSGLRAGSTSSKLARALADRLAGTGLAGTGLAGTGLAGTGLAGSGVTGASSAGDVVLAYLRTQAARMKAFDPLVRRAEPDSVHQMRVASRRLRSTLRSFGAILRAQDTSHLQGELRWLGQVLGEARDGEVLAERFDRHLQQIPGELVMGPVAARLRLHFVPRETAAAHAVAEALDSDRYLALLDELDRVLTRPPLTPVASAPAGDGLPAAVAHDYKRTRKRMRRALRLPAGPQRETAMHSARKAAKRARYAAEVLRPVSGKPANRFGKRMKKIQSVLGDHQDAVITRGTVRELGAVAAMAGENAFAYGVMHEREQAEAGRLQRRAGQAWKRASRPKYRRWLG